MCFHSTRIINPAALGKELDNSTVGTVANAIQYLERTNLIYTSDPLNLDGRKVSKPKPKIYITDAAIRNAMLVPENGLMDPDELEVMVESSVYKQMRMYYSHAGLQTGYACTAGEEERDVDVAVEGPQGRIVTEVKYCDNTDVAETDAIARIVANEKSGVAAAMVVTKGIEDYGVVSFKTGVPVMKIPAHAFLYLLGHAEKSEYLERK